MPPRKRARAPVISAAPTTIALQRGDHTSFLEGLAELWRAGTLCDVTVLVGGRSFKAHRLVLAASSPYFAAMNGGFAERWGMSVEEARRVMGARRGYFGYKKL